MRKCRGALTLEAAIVLPIFLCFVLSLAYFIKIIYVHENIQHAITHTADNLATYTYVLDKLDIENALDKRIPKNDAFHGMQSFIDLAVDKTNQSVKSMLGQSIISSLIDRYITPHQYNHWYIVGGRGGLDFSQSSFLSEKEDVAIVVHYDLKLPIPVPGLKKIHLIQRATSRLWKGNSNFASEVEQADKQMVYITEHGTKYHTNPRCRHIFIPTEKRFYKDIKNSRRPCEICAKQAKNLTDDTEVIVTSGGDCFHLDPNCYAINRKVKAITLEQAVNNGYTACKTCLKGENP